MFPQPTCVGGGWYYGLSSSFYYTLLCGVLGVMTSLRVFRYLLTVITVSVNNIRTRCKTEMHESWRLLSMFVFIFCCVSVFEVTKQEWGSNTCWWWWGKKVEV